MQLLGRSLQVSVENALRDRQLEDVRDTLRELGRIDPALDVWVLDAAGTTIAASGTGAIAPPALPTAPSDGMWLHFDPPDRPDHLIAVIPLQVPSGGQEGRLVVVRPLADVQQDLAATRRGIVLSVGTFMVLTLVLGGALGQVYITRPLDTLTAALRQIEAGDLAGARVSVYQQDEAGTLARAFNGMADALREARARLDDEADARRRMEQGLQRADKLITIGQLSAGLAHEIGSPLQVINGRARLMADHPDDPALVRRNAGIVAAETDRVARIVEQLLQHVRKRPAATQVHLETLVRRVLDVLEIEARRRGLDVQCDVGPEVPAVEGDPDRLQQVVLNLMTNAFQATPEGGRVSVRLEHTVPDAVRLTVSDTGCGIATDLRDRLFDPFFTTRDTDGGTGLGLAVVKAIVTDHGGTVDCASAPGQGSRFWVDLPAGPARVGV
jgi:signal transduction histidine kinase